MFIKKLFISLICFTLIISIVGCKKISDTTYSYLYSSSDLSFSSTVSEPSSSLQENASENQTSDSTITSPEEKYGFNKLTNVKYNCIKDIPYGDAQYEITTVTTDKGYALIYMIDLSCKDPTVTIDKLVVTIPYEYRKSHDSITLTATHRTAKISCEFTIKFDKWELIFEDNFDGTTLNTNVWNIWDEKRDSGYAYSKDAMFLDGKGNLINRMSILDNPDPKTGENRITGVITTKDKFETTYGYFEISMIPHRNMGLMGAFWLNCGDMSDDNAPKDNTAVNGCEIDIVETFYHTKTPAQTIHWDGYGWYQDENNKWQTVTKTQSLYVPPMENIFDGKYHTFSLFWTPEEYIFLIDGEVTNRAHIMGICNQPGYVLISSHFNKEAGEFIGNQTDMIVDYVKVYQNLAY